MIYCIVEFRNLLCLGLYLKMSTQKQKSQVAEQAESEVPLQVTVPRRIKHALDLASVKTGRTRRALVLEALRGVGVTVTDEDIAGRRGNKIR